MVSAGLAIGTMLVLLGFYGMLPQHVRSVSYSDPVDEEFSADLDVVELTGELAGPEFVIRLVMRGDANPDDGVYSVTVVARFEDGFEGTHIYVLEFYDGYEHNYYIFAYLEDGDLVFKFPLYRLLNDAYIVGLEGHVSGFSGSSYGDDWVNMGNRSEMSLSYRLDLGFNPLVPTIVGICVLFATAAAFTVAFGDRIRRTRTPPR